MPDDTPFYRGAGSNNVKKFKASKPVELSK